MIKLPNNHNNRCIYPSVCLLVAGAYPSHPSVKAGSTLDSLQSVQVYVPEVDHVCLQSPLKCCHESWWECIRNRPYQVTCIRAQTALAQPLLRQPDVHDIPPKSGETLWRMTHGPDKDGDCTRIQKQTKKKSPAQTFAAKHPFRQSFFKWFSSLAWCLSYEQSG